MSGSPIVGDLTLQSSMLDALQKMIDLDARHLEVTGTVATDAQVYEYRVQFELKVVERKH